MASSEAAKARKGGKRNFTVSEIAVLMEKVEENLQILQSKFTNNITNKLKTKVWAKIIAAVNATGLEVRTPAEAREKWKNLHSTAKRGFFGYQKEIRRTGGGPAPKSPSVATNKIVVMFRDAPSFVGLDGFESGKFREIKKIPANVKTHSSLLDI